MTEPAESKWKKVWGWVKSTNPITIFVVGALVGFGTNYWISYRSDYRSALETRLEVFSNLSTEVSDDLRVLFEVAEGRRAKDPNDVDALSKSLYDSVTEAQTLASRLSGSETYLAEYQTAAVELISASSAVTGPLDARPLVEATSAYLAAEDNLKKLVAQKYGAWF